MLLSLIISCTPPGKTARSRADISNEIHQGEYFESVIFKKENSEEYKDLFEADEFWTPAPEQIDSLENEIIGFLDGSIGARNNTVPPGTRKFLLHNLKRYKCQYIGIVRNNHRYIQGSFFIEHERFKNWKNDWVIFRDLNHHHWSLLFDSDSKVIETVTVN